MRKSFFIAVVLSMLLMQCSAFAYTEYSANSRFNFNHNGVYVDDQMSGGGDYAWYSSYNGRSGVLASTQYGSPSHYVTRFFVANSNASFVNSTSSNGSLTRIFIPKDAESILFANYYTNYSANISSVGLAFSLSTFDGYNYTSVLLVSSSTGNLSDGWHVMNLTLPPSASDRYVIGEFYAIVNSSVDYIVSFDDLKLFTFDITEARDDSTLFLNSTYERDRYCGNGSLPFIPATSSCTAFGFTFQDEAMSYSDGNGFYLARSDDGMGCQIFVINDTVFGRRIVNYTSAIPLSSYFVNSFLDRYSWIVVQTRDPYYIVVNTMQKCTGIGGGNCWCADMNAQGMLMTKFQLGSMTKYSFSDAHDIMPETFTYNGVPVNVVNLTPFFNSSASSVNLSLYSTQPSAGGTMWYLNTSQQFGSCPFDYGGLMLGCTVIGGASASFPFFNTPLAYSCTAQWSCDPFTNYEHYASSSCQNSNYQYCGDGGCNLTTNRCVAPCSGDAYWLCNNEFENWHYDSSCANDQQVLCDDGCEVDHCVGEVNCVSDSECQPYCDGDALMGGGSCNNATYLCSFIPFECPYGCSAGACSSAPIVPLFDNGDSSPLGVVGTITGSILGFLNVTGVPLFSMIFWIFVAVIIISIFSLVAWMVKHGFS